MNFIKSIEAFTLVVEKGSFTNAAEALDITPSLLSRQIKELEQYLGCQLLNRTTRKQGLTRAGECFLKYSNQIIATKAEAIEVLHQLNDKIAGNIRISSPIAFGNHILAPLISKFLLNYPEVNIEMDLTDRKVDLIENNFQLAIRIGDVVDEGVVAINLPPYSMVLVASPNYLQKNDIPIHPDDLIKHNCICFSQWHSNQYWSLEKSNKVYNVKIHPRFVSNTGESIRQAALNGLGIALNSRIMLEKDIQSGRLVEILPDFSIRSRSMSILRLPETPVPPTINTFIQFLLDSVKEIGGSPVSAKLG
ncbi:LysR family transcriptional regulator [Vibrio gazogenes]|uniref:HTH lysR-type domain-containing protein n=1 Tax=Vibrio gazogenes TaxID=687 RepID=A0A1Z2SE14_VIBGA|nr:LysR family transcriptional regulator [Vibrio gazogenes]ASA55419.1 hypothetical protein BSQ33_06620 [Vibrio gazogenes]